MKNNDLLEDLKAFRTPICEGLSAKIPYTDELADYLTDKGYRKQSEGEWLVKWRSTFPQYEPSEYECSNCGYRRTVLHKYCPNCGAKMKGGE